MIVLQALNQACHEVMAADERVLFMGEDVLDPYGGAFKVAQGLSTHFPDRVLTTPISEAAIVGMATGLAMRGFRPIVEIMFGDFLTLASDQIINHAAKFRWMYNDRVQVPLVIRTPMGGRRGYGPTHSQSIEKHWLGVPGLRIVAPNTVSDPGLLLKNAIIQDNAPVLFIENKLLYNCQILTERNLEDFVVETRGSVYPAITLSYKGVVQPDVTIACYGYMFELVREAVEQLVMQYELFAEIVVYTQINPISPEAALDSVMRTKRLVTVEEGSSTAGWGAELLSLVLEQSPPGRAISVERVASKEAPIASTRILEELALPSIADIVKAALKTVHRGNISG